MFVDVWHGVTRDEEDSGVSGAGGDEVRYSGAQRGGAGHVGHQRGVPLLLPRHHHVLLRPVT